MSDFVAILVLIIFAYAVWGPGVGVEINGKRYAIRIIDIEQEDTAHDH